MPWFKKHADTIAILVAFAGGLNWMHNQIGLLNNRMTVLEKDMAVIKAVLILQKTLPAELAKAECENNCDK